MAFTITDNGQYIDITETGVTTKSIKKQYITMFVDEPYLYIRYHEKELRENRGTYKLDFNDVTSPAEASATDLMNTILGWFTSGGGLSDGDYGDVTVSGGGTVITENIKANRVFNFWNFR